MGDKIVKSKNLCCQPVVFPSLSLLSTYLSQKGLQFVLQMSSNVFKVSAKGQEASEVTFLGFKSCKKPTKKLSVMGKKNTYQTNLGNL